MHSFGHAAYFGLGAYGAALWCKALGLPMEAALVARAAASPRSARCVFGWFCVRLSGVYLAMLTLAFAQIVWSVVFQWDGFTGGSNGLIGIWPAAWLARQAQRTTTSRCCSVAGGVLWLRRVLFAPFGYALRAGRDSPLRADAIGIDVPRMQWVAFVVAGTVRRPGRRAVRVLQGQHLAGDARRRQARSTALVMVLLGGVQTLAGPGGRRRVLHLAAGHRGAQDRLLARAARRRHPAARAGVPAWASPASLQSSCCGCARAGDAQRAGVTA